MSLHKSAMLVKLTVKQWDTFKKDRAVADRVDEEFDTVGKVGNYNKRLLSKHVTKPITTVIAKIREEHAERTTPWCYDGVSLLPSKLFLDYTTIMRGLKDRFDSAVDNFIMQYPIYKANRAAELGRMFRPEDYPARDDLRWRYEVSFKFFPVPQSDHFIVDLGTEDAERLKAELQKELVDTSTLAVKSLYDRIEDIVGHVHERLSDPANKFKDSTFENVVQLVEVLPALNVFNDPKISMLCHQIKLRIASVDPKDVRKSLVTRQEVANSAYDIVALLKGKPQEPQIIEVPTYATHVQIAAPHQSVEVVASY